MALDVTKHLQTRNTAVCTIAVILDGELVASSPWPCIRSFHAVTPAVPRRARLQVATKSVIEPADSRLQLSEAFAACEAADVLVMDSLACCRVCSRQIMWRVELCPACRGTFSGYTFYHMQGAYKAVHSGELRLFFGYFTEEV